MRPIRHLVLFTILYSVFYILPSPANAIVKLEQYLSITNQEFIAAENAIPTDNSLGLIFWNQDAFSDESVYFEAIIKCVACTGGNTQATATLYTAAGSPVTDAAVSTTNTGYTLVRSAAITSNLTDDTAYTARLSRDATAGNAYLISARLVVLQSAATAFTATQTQLEIGSAGSTTNTSYALPANPKIIRYDSSHYAPTPTITFEATLKSSISDQTATAALSTSSTCASTVDGSAVTVTGTDWARDWSDSLSLSTGTYFVCIKTSDAGATTSIANAKLVLSQSNSGGITKVRTHLPTHTSPLTDTDDSYTSPGAKLEFAPSNFSGAMFSYFYESILQTTAGTAYSQLYNTSDSSAVSNSELSTTETAFARVTSAEITGNLPSATKTLDTQLKNSATNTTTASGSWLIAQMTAYPNLSFSVEAVAANTATNGVTTSVASQANQLDFGSLTVGSPKYIAHRLSATTNAASGYTVSVKMNSTLQGNYPANIIEEFPATWESPQAWTEPTGTTANVNTGWFGANTSDTRVSGWSSGSGLFGPMGTTSHTLMQSSGIDGGTNSYITYVIEVNQYQPTDTYAGILLYSILPTY